MSAPIPINPRIISINTSITVSIHTYYCRYLRQCQRLCQRHYQYQYQCQCQRINTHFRVGPDVIDTRFRLGPDAINTRFRVGPNASGLSLLGTVYSTGLRAAVTRTRMLVTRSSLLTR